MELLLALVLPLALSAEPAAAASPRAPVNRIDRCGGPSTPGIPDPSGVYSGQVTFTFGSQGSFTQTWQIPLKSQPCLTCDPGQYIVSGTHYDLVEYQGGAVDRGSVSGVINPDGDGFLEFSGTNCAYISLGLGGSSTYRSGRIGPAPGADIKVSNGRLTGRVSGYDCYGTLVTADLNLPKQSGQPSTCAYFGGIYQASYSNSCGGSQSGNVILTQSGCSLSGYSAGAATAIQGVITGPNTATFDFESTDGCGGGTGTAHISGGVITGTYTGTSPGGPGCCAPGPFSGSFTFNP